MITENLLDSIVVKYRWISQEVVDQIHPLLIALEHQTLEKAHSIIEDILIKTGNEDLFFNINPHFIFFSSTKERTL